MEGGEKEEGNKIARTGKWKRRRKKEEDEGEENGGRRGSGGGRGRRVGGK